MTLTRSDWEQAAFRALLGGGPAAVAVVALAKALGATRGSFYHHFIDRNELLEASLARWERMATDELIARAETASGPAERLATLASLAFQIDRRTAQLELRLGAATEDPTIRKAVNRVERRRLEYLRTCFEDLGWSSSEASTRALLTYFCQRGILQAVASRSARARPAELTNVAQLLQQLIVAAPDRATRSPD